MKYYVYVSKTKIEMLHPQAKVSKPDKREASIGFDIKVLKGEIKESRDLDGSLYGKLSETIAFLDQAGKIGTLRQEKKPYIRGTCEMIWAGYGWEPDSGITFWTYQHGNLVLALAGSKFHVIGEQREGNIHSHSGTAAITSWIHANVGEPFEEEIVRAAKDQAEGQRRRPFFTDKDVADCVWLAVSQAAGQRSKFEFVAKVIHKSKLPVGYGDGDTKRIVLASPLYVALEQ